MYGEADLLQTAMDELKKTTGTYAELSTEITGMIGYVSGVMYDLTQVNSGKYVQSILNTWKRGARDAYRVNGALDEAIISMAVLGTGISQHMAAIQTVESDQNSETPLMLAKNGPLYAQSPDYQKALAQTTSDLDAIASLAQTFATTLSSQATSQVMGGCSTGLEPLAQTLTDGTNPNEYISWLEQQFADGNFAEEPTSGNGQGNGNGANGGDGSEGNGNGDNGDSAWRRFLENYCKGPGEDSKTLGAFQSWLSSKNMNVNIMQWFSRPTLSFFVTLGYTGSSVGIQDFLHVKGNPLVNALAVGTVTGLFDGQLYFDKLDKIKVSSKYTLANCSGLATVGQFLVGFTSNTIQLGLLKLLEGIPWSGTQNNTKSPSPYQGPQHGVVSRY